MNKKEKEAMDTLENLVRLLQAMRFTEDVPPDLPVPDVNGRENTQGWQFNSHSLRVEDMWSSANYHGQMNGSTTQQKGIPLYSTKYLALKAMRREKELEFAGILADIDRKIEQAKTELL